MDTATTDTFGAMAEAGLSPVDDLNPSPGWLCSRYDGGLCVTDGYLVASCDSDCLYLARLTPSGVINEELRFPAPDGEVSPLTLAAFAAVVAVWCES